MDKIAVETFKFLEDLKSNNNREWFAENKHLYIAAKEDVTDFLDDLVIRLKKHDHIDTSKVMRIYRDIRFSKNKTPYKNNFAISISRATAALRGGMYVNIEPGNTLIAGGFWAPESKDLKRIRNEFAVDSQEFRKIISSKSFTKYFGSFGGSELKSAPRGFDKNHPNIDLIRKKQYVVHRDISDSLAQSKEFISECDKTFKAMRPFFDYMSTILTTDENGESIL